MAKLKCTDGNYQCGDKCQPERFKCHSSVNDPEYANAFVEYIIAAAKQKEQIRSGGTIEQSKQQVESARQAKSDEELQQIAKQSMTTLSPEEAKAVLMRKLPNGLTIEQHAEWLRNQPFANSSDEQNYVLPGSKLRDVSDEEVDKLWTTLPTNVKDWLFPSGAGAPDRASDRVKAYWEQKGGTPEMRKAMLKAMLQQTAVLKTGGLEVHDPWSADGIMRDTHPDLDHNVPISKGGDHDAHNWTWIDHRINQAYKSDRDIPGVVDQLKLAAYGDGKRSAEELYNKKISDQVASLKAKVTAIDLRKEIATRASGNAKDKGLAFTDTLPTLDEWVTRASNTELRKYLMYGLEDAGIIPKGTVAAWKKFPSGYQNRLGYMLLDKLNIEYQNSSEVLGKVMSTGASKAKIAIPLDILAVLDSKKHNRYNDLSTMTDLQTKRFSKFVESVRPSSLRPDSVNLDLQKAEGDWRKIGKDTHKWLQTEGLIIDTAKLDEKRRAQLEYARNIK